MNYSVYKIANTFNSNIYIGMTRGNVLYRFQQHISQLSCSIHSSKLMCSDFITYGKKSFSISIVKSFDNKKDCLKHEYKTIWELKPKYNNKTFQNSLTGIPVIKKGNQKISISLPDELIKAVEDAKEKYERNSFSDMISYALKKFLNIKPEKK